MVCLDGSVGRPCVASGLAPDVKDNRHSGEPWIGVQGRHRNSPTLSFRRKPESSQIMVVYKSCQSSGCRIRSGMTRCIVIPANPRSGVRVRRQLSDRS